MTVLARLQVASSLAKPKKPQNALDRKIRKTGIIVDKNRKPKTKKKKEEKLEKTCKLRKTLKPKNRSFKCENRTKSWLNQKNWKS